MLLHSFAFLPYGWFCKLSGEERPWGSLPAFASGDVATRIPSITAGHSLSPRSCARTAIGRPCSLLSPGWGAIRGFHVPLAEVRRVRCLLLIGKRMGHERAWSKRCSHLHYHFGSSVVATSACSTLRSLAQVQISSPYRLSSAHPACGCQKGMLLTIDTPHVAVLRCIVRVALDSDSLIHPVTRVVPSVSAGTTPTSDFVSHRPVVDRLTADAKFRGNLGQFDPASEQQHTCGPGPRVAMFVVHGQLLQRLILGFGQFYDTLHR